MIRIFANRFFSTNKVALHTGIISTISDPCNPLKSYPVEYNVKVISSLSDDELLSLKLQDWHRIFENITPKDWSRVKISKDLQEKSLFFLSKMKSLGITPDAFIYSSLYKIFSDDFKKVLEFYKFVLRSEKDKLSFLKNSTQTYPCSSGSVKLLNNRSIQILLEIYNSKHSSYQLKNLLLNLWDDLKFLNLKLSKETYIAFLKSKGIEKTEDFVSNIHQKLKWRKVVLKEKWDQETYSALMNAYSLMGCFDAVDKLYIEMKHDGLNLDRDSFTAYLRVLEQKDKFKRILLIQKEMESLENSFENKSIEILLNSSLKSGNSDNVDKLYQKCLSEIEKGSMFVTWRSLECCLRVYSRLGNAKVCNQIYEKYKVLRIKVSSEYNTKYNLTRPVEASTNANALCDFSRLYMLPEPPRDVLYQMAYVYGYNMDVESIMNFFKQDVFDPERLALYHYRKKIGLSKEIKNEIDKAQKKIENIRSHKSPEGGSLIRMYKDNISKNNKNLKRSGRHIQVGREGPLAIVYDGLIEGWKKGIENLRTDDVGSHYLSMDSLVKDLIEIEILMNDPYTDDPDYEATDLVSKFPPPFFPPNSKSRFHPYSAHKASATKLPDLKARKEAEAFKTPKFRSDKQVPHTESISWMPESKWNEIADKDLLITVGKVSYPDYNEFSMEELAEKLNVERLKSSKLPRDLFVVARSKSNPYEAIYKSHYKHYDAIKMANLDKLSMLTPKDKSQQFKFLTFGVSSGVAEYLLFNMKNSQGYGINVANKGLDDKRFTNLIEKIDWKGLTGIYTKILNETDSKGVDFVSAFTDILDLNNDDMNAEHHYKRILILELHTMFNLLKIGGNFVLRMFDINTKFSVDIVYILYRYFSKVAICKPLSSRACENERFIVCKGFRKDKPHILNHLAKVYDSFGSDSSAGDKIISFKDQVRLSNETISSIVSSAIIKEDEDFIDSIQGSNMKLVIREREALEELLKYAGKGIILEYDQSEIRDRCFLEWNIPA